MKIQTQTESPIFSLYIVFLSLSCLVLYVQAVPNSNSVVFRLDDIQDEWITPAQIQVMNVFKQTKTPLTIGIIANIFGKDKVLVDYVKAALKVPNWNLEIANHGWNHEYFDKMSEYQQKSLLKLSINKTLSILSPQITSIKSFIPPYNAFNAATIKVLKELGFTTMSSQTEVDVAPYDYEYKSFYRWPIGAATSDMRIDQYFIGIEAADTLRQIKNQIRQFGFASVMMHPQEFCVLNPRQNHDPTNNVDDYMLNQLRTLIRLVRSEGIEITTFGKLSEKFAKVLHPDAPVTPTPSSINNINAPVSMPASVPADNYQYQYGEGAFAPFSSFGALTTGSRSKINSNSVGSGSITTGKPQRITTSTSSISIGSNQYQPPSSSVSSGIKGCDSIAFKIEQVQDYYKSVAFSAVLREFKDNNIPVTIGVIPFFLGADNNVLKPIKDAVFNCTIKAEIAVNGYRFEDFTTQSYNSQKNLLSRAKTKIFELFKTTPRSFFPPMFKFNQNTTKALASEGFKWLSGHTNSDPGPYERDESESEIFRFPAKASTFSLQDNLISGLNSTVVWSQVQQQLDSQSYAVILMTPAEFSSGDGSSVNPFMIAQLRKLFNIAKSSGKKLVLISEMSECYGVPSTVPVCNKEKRNIY